MVEPQMVELWFIYCGTATYEPWSYHGEPWLDHGMTTTDEHRRFCYGTPGKLSQSPDVDENLSKSGSKINNHLFTYTCCRYKPRRSATSLYWHSLGGVSNQLNMTVHVYRSSMFILLIYVQHGRQQTSVDEVVARHKTQRQASQRQQQNEGADGELQRVFQRLRSQKGAPGSDVIQSRDDSSNFNTV